MSTFERLWSELYGIGRGEDGGYRRFTWTRADQQCRDWFAAQAQARGLELRTDRNGNRWAWWPAPGHGAIVTGSHLDSVPAGGAFDGPLGIVAAFAAIDRLRERGVTPARPVAVAAFIEEEGARFGAACLGSKLLTGVVTPEAARALTDDAGVTFASAMADAGLDPHGIGPDDDLLASVAAFIELHIEQGRALAPLGAPLALAESIWPHGRWRFTFGGRADHAGTARFADRIDPMLPFASTVLAARELAAANGALATFGKLAVEPGGVNGVPSTVRAWLDARGPDEALVARVVAELGEAAGRFCAPHGVTLQVRQESSTPEVRFDQALRARIAEVLGDIPVLPTGAGHDAGVLAARIPAAMLFVRNPTGVSHSPQEHATLEDCEAGVTALAAVLDQLTR
ncbi:MAG TPA: allantoate amidohydrolase [Trebonia sp.]|jgi:N-carbamoyl-L-amino-acid hydrolase